MKMWLLYFFILLFIPVFSYSAVPDTTKHVSWKLNETFDTTRVSIDTLLYDFQLINPNTIQSFSNSMTGNFGLPFISNVFDIYPNQAEFTFLNPFKNYMYRPEDIVYHNSKKPFTVLTYFLGSNKAQALNILHTQNVNENFNFGLKYNLVSVEGPIKRQKARDHAMTVFSSYSGERYSLFFNIIYNRFSTIENGGIASDSIFDRTNNPVETLPINLSSASSEIDNKSIGLTQKLNLTKSIIQSDDTCRNRKINYKFMGTLIHNFKYEQFSRTYIDTRGTDVFYQNWFNDTIKTKDSVYYKRLENTILYKINDNYFSRNPVGMKLGASFQLNKYGYSGFDTLFRNTSVFGSFFNETSKKFNWEIFAKYYADGFQKGNMFSDFKLKKYFKEKNDSSWLSLEASYNKTRPDWYELKYSSNNFLWDNKFKDKEETKLRIEYNNNKYKFNIGFRYTTIDKFIYYDSITALPKQADSSRLTITSAYFNKNFQFWKIHLNNYIIYQYADKQFLRIPDIVLYHSLFIRLNLFKGKLPTHFGFDFYYNSYYYGYAYMPATNVFYLQNDKKLGGHPYVDVFISATRKRARMYLKAEHLSSVFGKRNYYNVEHYPMNEWNIRFGMSWRFFD